MKSKISVLTIILAIISVIFISQAFFYYGNQKEKSAECLEIPPQESYIPCHTFSYIYFDRWINWSAFSLIFVFLTFLSWRFDLLNNAKKK